MAGQQIAAVLHPGDTLDPGFEQVAQHRQYSRPHAAKPAEGSVVRSIYRHHATRQSPPSPFQVLPGYGGVSFMPPKRRPNIGGSQSTIPHRQHTRGRRMQIRSAARRQQHTTPTAARRNAVRSQRQRNNGRLTRTQPPAEWHSEIDHCVQERRQSQCARVTARIEGAGKAGNGSARHSRAATRTTPAIRIIPQPCRRPQTAARTPTGSGGTPLRARHRCVARK